MPKLPPSWPNCGWPRAASTTRNVSSPDLRTSRRRRYACAALHLAQGASKAAIALVRRRLRSLAEEYRERAALLDLLVEALVAQGDDRDLVAPLEEVAAIPTVDATLVAAHRHRALGRGLAAAR